jgi:multiple sugar transport system permease protein
MALAHPSPVRVHRGTARHFAERHFAWLVLVPALLLLFLISVFPIIYNLIISFQQLTLLDQDTSFAGLLNYRELAVDGRFWGAIGHTLLIAAIALPLQVVIGLAIAYLFVEDLWGKRWMIAILMLPSIISPIVVGASWKLMFDNQYGPVNQIIGWIIGHHPTLIWTINPILVYPAIILVEVWEHTPFVFLLLLAAMANVDRSLVESAAIDGASGWLIFRRVILPAIRPVLMIVVIIRALDLMRLFEIVWALTRGGPGTQTETLSIYVYLRGFQEFDTSYTAAMAFAVVAILALVTFVALRSIARVR